MASLKELKNRISSVKSTRKITKAMQMVAAAKLRRAQDAVEASRPYSKRIERVLASLAEGLKNDPEAPRLLVGTGSEKVHLLIVMTSERGLCGAFNASIARKAREAVDRLQAEGKTVRIMPVGRKGREILKRDYRHLFVGERDLGGVKQIRFEHASEIASSVIEMFNQGEFDVCTMFFSKFESVVTQIPTAQQLIPAPIPELDDTDDMPDLKGALYDYEPDEATIVTGLLPLNIGAQIFKGLLENAASEQGARMSAMDNATRNAGEMIDDLTMEYNRSRQAAITTELIEIISGAEALNN